MTQLYLYYAFILCSYVTQLYLSVKYADEIVLMAKEETVLPSCLNPSPVHVGFVVDFGFIYIMFPYLQQTLHITF